MFRKAFEDKTCHTLDSVIQANSGWWMGKCVVTVSWGWKGHAKETELIPMAQQSLVGQDLLLLKLQDHTHTTIRRILLDE